MNDKKRRNQLLKKLKAHNKAAHRYLQHSFSYKEGYSNLQKSNIWKQAKQELLELIKLRHGDLSCSFCGLRILPERATLHHHRYKRKKLFHPKYIAFVHQDCHEAYHLNRGVPAKRIRISISFHGIRIYTECGMMIVPIWLIFAIILVIGLMTLIYT